jgi:hypothetical protein
MLLTSAAGLLAGLVHVLSGPDHLAAIAPFAAHRSKQPWVPGALWGLGHCFGVGLISLLAWMLRDALPLERLSAVSEQIVGFVLIFLGFWTLRRALRTRVHTHVHEHDGEQHAHVHLHSARESTHSSDVHRHGHAPLWIGIVHGAAGSAHLWAILPALALPSRGLAAGYLVGYGTGTIVAMIGFTALLGVLAARAGSFAPVFYRRFLSATGVFAIVVGIAWLLPR